MRTVSIEKSEDQARSEAEYEAMKEEKFRLFFEKKAAEAAIFMKNNPLPYELSKQAWDERKAKKKP